MRLWWLTTKERDVPAFQAPFEIKKNKRNSVRRDSSATNTTNCFVKPFALWTAAVCVNTRLFHLADFQASSLMSYRCVCIQDTHVSNLGRCTWCTDGWYSCLPQSILTKAEIILPTYTVPCLLTLVGFVTGRSTTQLAGEFGNARWRLCRTLCVALCTVRCELAVKGDNRSKPNALFGLSL